MSSRILSRRTMLRGAVGGAAVALALPTLEAMMGSKVASAAALPPIFGMFYWANGMPWPGMQSATPSFELIENPREVFEVVRKAQGTG